MITWQLAACSWKVLCSRGGKVSEWVLWTASSFPSWCGAELLRGLQRTMASIITCPAGSPHPCPENFALVNSSCKDCRQWLTPSPERNTKRQSWPNPLSGLTGFHLWAGVWNEAESPLVRSWGRRGLGRVLGLGSIHRVRQLWGMEKRRGWTPTASQLFSIRLHFWGCWQTSGKIWTNFT